MNNMKKITILAPYICLLIFIAYMLGNGLVEGFKNEDLLIQRKGTVKTIKSDDGDIIDCVDIYKQPAFDHPMLKNHKIQMQPNSFPERIEAINSTSEMVQSWHKFGQCPDKTVPIRRSPQSSMLTKSRGLSEYAQVSQLKTVHGAYAVIGVWGPKVETGEYSAARVQIFPGEQNDLNSVEAGWIVNADLYGDNQPRLYAYWTSDNFQSTGCYNLDCSGFVQISRTFTMGSALIPVSTYEGKKYEISVELHNEKKTNFWWVVIQNCLVGYWPSEIFTNVTVNTGSRANWGGEVMNKNSAGHHTTTQMGSGHFLSEDIGKASVFHTMGYVDPERYIRYPENLQVDITNPTYYTLQLTSKNSFAYGGPGYYGA